MSAYTILIILLFCLTNLATSKIHRLNRGRPPLEQAIYNERPIIGVFAQPSDYPKQYPTENYSYIATSYIKFIESAGARAVPIPYDLPKEQLKYLFESINGLIFPGGSALLTNGDFQSNELSFSNMTLAGQYLIELALEANKNGDYFPVWGTCLGYELLMMAISNDINILDRLNSSNHVLTIKFVSNETRIFENLEPILKNYSENTPSLYFNHHFGITPEHFISNPILNEIFVITSISKTENGTTFVSSVEAKELPFYGIQFHPEKSPFEWRKEIFASHSLEAIEISQHIADFFVDEARKNFHNFKTEKEADQYTIYNYNAVKVVDTFMECYFFPKPNAYLN